MTLKQFERKIMKQNLLLLLAVVILLFAATQTKAQQHLPDTVTVRLSQRDLFAITQLIDNLQQSLSNTACYRPIRLHHSTSGLISRYR